MATSSSTTSWSPNGDVFAENSRTSVAVGGVCALSAGEGYSLSQNLKQWGEVRKVGGERVISLPYFVFVQG